MANKKLIKLSGTVEISIKDFSGMFENKAEAEKALLIRLESIINKPNQEEFKVKKSSLKTKM